jgi:hypothetical protein
VEADWEIELGGDAPLIDAFWPGFVDLRRIPEKASELTEVLQLPALGPVLLSLNSSQSPLFTAKCDLWPVTEIDPLEFDAPQAFAAQGMAVYLDFIPCARQLWPDPNSAIAWSTALCTCLKSAPLLCCRVDLIIRRAITSNLDDGIGITAYVAACGPTVEAARAHLGSVLAVFANSILPEGTRGAAHSTPPCSFKIKKDLLRTRE